MKASLDTNVIIHLYRANQENLLHNFFTDGILIYEQIRNIELRNHGQDILDRLDQDILGGKIQLYTDKRLRELNVFRIFCENVKENKYLYGSGDLGEIYAISLAQTLGAYSLVTDDIKQGGPYMSLLQFIDNDIMPFTFVDIILLKHLSGEGEAVDVIKVFDKINRISNLKWSLKAHLERFIKRFWTDPYQKNEKEWMEDYCRKNNVDAVKKIKELRNAICG